MDSLLSLFVFIQSYAALSLASVQRTRPYLGGGERACTNTLNNKSCYRVMKLVRRKLLLGEESRDRTWPARKRYPFPQQNMNQQNLNQAQFRTIWFIFDIQHLITL